MKTEAIAAIEIAESLTMLTGISFSAEYDENTEIVVVNESLEIATSLYALLGTEFTANPDGDVARADAAKPAKKTTRKNAKKAAKNSQAAAVLVVAEAPTYSIRQLKAIAATWNRSNPQAKLKGWNQWSKARLTAELQALNLL